ncbi:aspartate aminotransferase family protein [Cohnella sp. JJ-181]|uniref:aspartate aminotransferase family protein n=1 Tax=Cohnella rhizoplanae TaxID=2974897 RepID=UPI0022FFAB86|nr:aspartate aminotransferase family protein [Cohnella sp. JJ-181]CAI6048318.1 Glutamate-1-semialdehyde 2,1-aminomutase [Cohnella sp. JJ-181]
MRSYEKSRSLLAEAREVLAGGVASSLRASMRPVPLYAASAEGARVRDADGNEYIDYLLGYGPLILGHAPEAVTDAVHRAMRRGAAFGLQHEGEIALARLLADLLPCADKVAYSGSGTEAVMLALRLARAHTGRRRIVRFHGHYHGWSDAIFTSFPAADMRHAEQRTTVRIPPGTAGQSDGALGDIFLLPWNDEEALESLLRAEGADIAAVITEPVMCNSGCIRPKPGYLERMRSLTAELGIVMIMDEVITGFRLGPGGAHGRFGILPDLAVVGKALGGGFAVSAVAGRREIMDLIEDGTVGHLGTLNGNSAAMAAAIATVEALSRDDAYARMEALMIRLAEGIRGLLVRHGVRGVVNQLGPVFHLMFVEADEVSDFDTFQLRDARAYGDFAARMLAEGVLLRPSGLWYISAAHGEGDVDRTLDAADRALAGMKRTV